MAIEFQCKSCSKKLRVKEQHAGKSVKCPECGTKLRVPEADTFDEEGFDDDGFDDWGMEDDSAPPPPRRPKSKPKKPKPRKFTETSTSRSSSSGGELSGGDWLLIILCGNIACIVGIIACINGDSDRGVKMILYPIVINFALSLVWGVLMTLVQLAAN